MRWVMPFFCIIEYDCGKSIYMNDVLLSYYWGGDNVWKWFLLSHKRHQAIFTYFNKPSCWNIINLGLQKNIWLLYIHSNWYKKIYFLFHQVEDW